LSLKDTIGDVIFPRGIFERNGPLGQPEREGAITMIANRRASQTRRHHPPATAIRAAENYRRYSPWSRTRRRGLDPTRRMTMRRASRIELRPGLSIRQEPN